MLPPAAPLAGRNLKHYRILEKIGAGGMGVVYRAQDERLARDVAVKVLPPGTAADEEDRNRFRREAMALSRLNHPNIETVFDFDTENEVDFLVLELIPGLSLDIRLAAGPLKEKEVAELGVQLAHGLEAAHQQGVIHRDLKPANLRVTPDGRLKILDFGLAKFARREPDLTTTVGDARAVTGTLPYMAPEQLRGETVDARTDLWAAGCVLYEMAVGRRPFSGDSMGALSTAILYQQPVAPRAVNPGIGAALEAVILKCLDKEPENRYQSARELAVDLRRSAPGYIASGHIEVAHRRPLRWRTWLLAAGVALALVAVLVVVGRQHLLGRRGPSRIESLAVLPLENLSGSPEQDYFAEGMTDELITKLAEVSALKVISRTSVARYRGTREPRSQIAHELKVDALIEGAVLRSGDRVRITAQLIDPESARNIWSRAYEGNLKDVLALQSDVAQAIVREIKVKLKPAEQARLTTSQSLDPEAYELYLKGRYQWNRRTGEGMEKALTYFQEAIGKDPNYALAYAGVADCYAVLAAYGLSPAEEAYPLGEQAAQKALQLDDTLAEAHASVASFKTDNHDWSGGIKEFERAIELNPNYATAHQWYAETLMKVGRQDDALREIQRAQQLDPLSLIINAVHGHLLYLARQYDQAITQCRKTLELDPNFYRAYLCAGLSYEQKMMFGDAIVHLQKGMSLPGGNTTQMSTALAHVYAMAGQNTKALGLAKKLDQGSPREYVDFYWIALVYSALGEKDQAFTYLEKAFRARSEALTFVRADPQADPLRSDARFRELLHSMNLPE
jgi:serine/threonine protein kinase/tetratricopeptide (TPR) repeat protein